MQFLKLPYFFIAYTYFLLILSLVTSWMGRYHLTAFPFMVSLLCLWVSFAPTKNCKDFRNTMVKEWKNPQRYE